MSFLQDRMTMLGNGEGRLYNKKLCFEAQSTLYSCADKQPNGNKYRCPDELYAYDMWCPTEFQTLASAERRQDAREA